MDSVECRSDTDYAERPVALTWQGQRLEILEILTRWRGPDEKGFKVKTRDDRIFILVYREVSDEWHIEQL